MANSIIFQQHLHLPAQTAPAYQYTTTNQLALAHLMKQKMKIVVAP